jgi:hypothetical protein
MERFSDGSATLTIAMMRWCAGRADPIPSQRWSRDIKFNWGGYFRAALSIPEGQVYRAFSEPAVYTAQQICGFSPSALLPKKICESSRGAKLERLRLLPLCHIHREAK